MGSPQQVIDTPWLYGTELLVSYYNTKWQDCVFWNFVDWVLFFDIYGNRRRFELRGFYRFGVICGKANGLIVIDFVKANF